MKNLYTFSLLTMAASGLLTTTALAGDKAQPTPMSKVSFSSFDQNHDGLVSPNELRNNFLGRVSDEAFSSYDFNRNGSYSQDEFNAFMTKNYQLARYNHQEAEKIDQRNDMMKIKAEKHNQMIEAHAASEKNLQHKYGKIHLVMDFETYDKNNDNVVNAAELTAQTGAVDAAREIAKFDRDKNGTLNISEFKAYVNSDPVIQADIQDLLKTQG